MFCPGCGTIKYSKQWGKAQWASCCKITEDGNYVYDPNMHPQRLKGCKTCIASETMHVTDCPMPDATQIEECEPLILALSTSLRSWDVRNFAIFCDWWLQISKSLRKYWSYFGALPSYDNSPVDYTCPEIGSRYFDPGNYIYGVTMRLMVLRSCHWNDVTMGDMFESWMGGCWLLTQYPEKAHCASRKCHHCIEQLSQLSRYWVHTLAAFDIVFFERRTF